MQAERLEVIARSEIRRTLQRLPEPVREAAADCLIECEMMADLQESGDDPGLEEDLLGLFEGCSRADPEPLDAGQLPRIRLFLDNLWEHAGRRVPDYREEVRVTLLHELGNYLGLDEAQVAALGLA